MGGPRHPTAPLTPALAPQLQLEKHKGEILGVVVVESGWGSILPTVILANMMNGGPAARSGKLSIGDQIMSIDGTSLVGLPLATCQGIIKVGPAPCAPGCASPSCLEVRPKTILVACHLGGSLGGEGGLLLAA